MFMNFNLIFSFFFFPLRLPYRSTSDLSKSEEAIGLYNSDPTGHDSSKKHLINGALVGLQSGETAPIAHSTSATQLSNAEPEATSTYSGEIVPYRGDTSSPSQHSGEPDLNISGSSEADHQEACGSSSKHLQEQPEDIDPFSNDSPRMFEDTIKPDLQQCTDRVGRLSPTVDNNKQGGNDDKVPETANRPLRSPRPEQSVKNINAGINEDKKSVANSDQPTTEKVEAEYQYEDDFEDFNDAQIWDTAFETAITSDDEVWSISSNEEDEDDDDNGETLEELLSTVPWTDATTHLKSVIVFCKCTISKAQTALRKWLKISRAPFPSYYKGQEKIEAIEYLGDAVRYSAEDFLHDVTRTFMEHPPKVMQELETLREKQKSFLRKLKGKKVPQKSWPTSSRDLAYHYLDVSVSRDGKRTLNRVTSKDDAKKMKVIPEVIEEEEEEEEAEIEIGGA